jgi:transglutaminase-like putative cysteine protease
LLYCRVNNDEFEVLQINTDRGVKQRAQARFTFSTTLQALDIVEAYTTTKDGKRIDVPADKILEQQSPVSAGAPTFDDAKVKTIVFPAVEVGATLTMHVRKTQTTPLFPEQFSLVEGTHRELDYRSETVTVTAPAEMPLRVDVRGFQGGQQRSPASGQQVWRWELKDLPGQPPELGSVGYLDTSPRVVVSSFASYEAVARAYAKRASPKAAVTPTIQALAEQITKGISDRREQANALYRWVSTHIRYVAIFLEFGGVVPHSADEIAAAKYGDCKDHSTLLQALLAAKGIASSPVLINSTNNYQLPDAPVPLGVFNHAINYLPEFKLFVDSTPGLGMFGALPPAELGKPALVVDAGQGEPKLMTAPVANAKDDTVNIEIDMTVSADGTVVGKSKVVHTGAFDLVARMVFSSLPPGVESQLAERLLTLSGQSGTGTYHTGTLRDLTQPFAFATEFNLPNVIQLPGPGAFSVPQGLSSLSTIANALEPFVTAQRSLPVSLAGRAVNESVRIGLPEGLTLANLPAPVEISLPQGRYTSRFTLSGRTLTVLRSLNLTIPSGLIDPADYAAMRGFAQQVQRDLRRQILY